MFNGYKQSMCYIKTLIRRQDIINIIPVLLIINIFYITVNSHTTIASSKNFRNDDNLLHDPIYKRVNEKRQVISSTATGGDSKPLIDIGSSTTYNHHYHTLSQRDGEKPIQTQYSWSSSSNNQPISGSSSSNQFPVAGSQPASSNVENRETSSLVSETITKRYKIPNLADDNVIDDNKEKSSLKIYPTDTQFTDQTSSNTERISYNVSIIRDIINLPKNNVPISNQVCPANHFGNEVIGCKKCECNDNVDLTENSCDPITGRCSKCLYNTEGDHCDRCKKGFSGDATKRLCRECLCNRLGTEPTKLHECHPVTGQCSCLPNVQGLDCSSCRPGFYNLTSGLGCQACKCSSPGSKSQSCNALDGSCECHSGYGGVKCNECPLGQWGDPKTRCQSCQCNRDGSSDQYCNVRTGQCNCLTGIGGDKCDRCARGYHGRFPNCEFCGECWQGWASAVDQLRNETQALLDRVRLLLVIGTTGAYAKEFNEIEAKLDRIKNILDSQKLNEADIRSLAEKVKELSDQLKALERQLSELEKLADDVTNRTIAVRNGLDDYNKIAERLTLLIEGLRENATQFQEANVDGAYAIILDSQNRSREAEKRVRDLKPLMTEQEQLRRTTEFMMGTMSSRYNSTSLQNEAILAALERQIYELEQGVPGVNQLVCASSSTVDKCDQLCGGALCQKCGGLSCSEGATTKASNALDLAQQAWQLLNSKFNQTRADLDAINEAKRLSEEALRQAKQVLADCELQKAKFDKVGNELNSIMDGVEKFNMMDGAKPAEVRTLGTECLGLSISLTPEQILALARQINDTISSLTNIDLILQQTAGDLNTAEQLRQQADRAKEAADNILETVEQVLNMLRLAALEQARAAAAIAAAQADIDGAQGDLAEISAETERLLKIVAELAAAIKRLQDRLNELRKKYAQNELYISQTRATADEAAKLADQAEKDADELADKVRLAQEKLANKALQNGVMKDRAERLKNDALGLAGDIHGKLTLLQELDDIFDEHLKRLKDYQDIVDDLHKQMNQYIKDIDMKAQYYRDCQT